MELVGPIKAARALKGGGAERSYQNSVLAKPVIASRPISRPSAVIG